jgi:hypothetical protein
MSIVHFGSRFRFHRSSPTIASLLFLVVAGACNETESSTTPENTDSPQEAGPRCVPEPTQLVNLDATVSGGINGRMILERAQGLHAFTFALDTPRENVSVAPESLGVAGSMEISYQAGSVRHIASRREGCVPGQSCQEIVVTCTDTLEVDVMIRFRSDDGAFNENWPGTLRAADMSDPDWQAVLDWEETLEDPSTYAYLDLEIDDSARQGSMNFSATLANSIIERKILHLEARFELGTLRFGELRGEVYGHAAASEGQESAAFVLRPLIYQISPVTAPRLKSE